MWDYLEKIRATGTKVSFLSVFLFQGILQPKVDLGVEKKTMSHNCMFLFGPSGAEVQAVNLVLVHKRGHRMWLFLMYAFSLIKGGLSDSLHP